LLKFVVVKSTVNILLFVRKELQEQWRRTIGEFNVTGGNSSKPSGGGSGYIGLDFRKNPYLALLLFSNVMLVANGVRIRKKSLAATESKATNESDGLVQCGEDLSSHIPRSMDEDITQLTTLLVERSCENAGLDRVTPEYNELNTKVVMTETCHDLRPAEYCSPFTGYHPNNAKLHILRLSPKKSNLLFVNEGEYGVFPKSTIVVTARLSFLCRSGTYSS